MLKDRRTYEIMRPEEVGVPQATLVLGKHSGRHAVQRRCEQIGITLERQSSRRSTGPSCRIADREKVVSDRDLARRRRPRSAASVRRPARPPASPTSTAPPPKSATATASRSVARFEVQRHRLLQVRRFAVRLALPN